MRNKVKERRKSAHLTQAQLAEQSGYAQSNICAIENEKLNLNVRTAKLLAKPLGCKWWELFED